MVTVRYSDIISAEAQAKITLSEVNINVASPVEPGNIVVGVGIFVCSPTHAIFSSIQLLNVATSAYTPGRFGNCETI